MGALIVLLCLIIFVIIYLLFSLNQKTDTNNTSLSQIKDQLKKVTEQLEALQKQPGTVISKEERSEIIPEIKTQPEIKQVIPGLPAQKPKEEPKTIEPEFVNAEDYDERALDESRSSIIKSKKNTDLEKFIGENLANKIGIAVLVLGISFFVKYAIDKEWINELGRVTIGFICGGILIGIAHYIRHKYRSFSSVLIGGGLTVFYFTTAYAFHQYHLIGQQPAFIIMVVISAFAVILSLYYDRQELAIIATIGGFITPFLVATGQGNYIALFTYLGILNTALTVLAWFKKWPAINSIALIFTTIIFGSWVITRTLFRDDLPYNNALLFATFFYLQFICMNLVNNLRLRNQFKAFDFIIVLSVNFLYYLIGIYIISTHQSHLKGLFTLSLALFNFLLLAVFYKNQRADRNFISLLTGLVLTFVSLIPLVQFSGNIITLFWAAETVILLWMYQRTRMIHLKLASVTVFLLMFASLFYTWFIVYLAGDKIIPIIINKGFTTSFAVSVALFIYAGLIKKEKNPLFLSSEIPIGTIAGFIGGLAYAIAYFTGALEISYQFITRYPGTEIHTLYIQAFSFAAAIIILSLHRRSGSFPILKLALTTISLAIYLFYLRTGFEVSAALSNSPNSLLFMAHWMAGMLLLWLLADSARYCFGAQHVRFASFRAELTCLASMSLVFLLSVEMYHIMLWTHPGNENDLVWWENLYYKAGLSILWSLCSFTMIWLGIRKNFQPLRILGLTLFSITLIKLFFYDIRNIPPGGKIAAFILLGILLLTVSFMYQRLKKILIDKPEA